MYHHKNKAFTLLELLVVVVLLGIVTSFAVLSMNITGLDTELNEEARKIHALINLAKEEAIIHAKEIAFVVEEDKYAFMYWGAEGEGKKKKLLWKPIEKKIFRERQVHKGMEILLETEKKFDLGENDEEEKFNATIFSSTGEQSKFELKIYLENDKQIFYLINGKYNGDVIIEKNGQDDF